MFNLLSCFVSCEGVSDLWIVFDIWSATCEFGETVAHFLCHARILHNLSSTANHISEIFDYGHRTYGSLTLCPVTILSFPESVLISLSERKKVLHRSYEHLLRRIGSQRFSNFCISNNNQLKTWVLPLLAIVFQCNDRLWLRCTFICFVIIERNIQHRLMAKIQLQWWLGYKYSSQWRRFWSLEVKAFLTKTLSFFLKVRKSLSKNLINMVEGMEDVHELKEEFSRNPKPLSSYTI